MWERENTCFLYLTPAEKNLYFHRLTHVIIQKNTSNSKLRVLYKLFQIEWPNQNPVNAITSPHKLILFNLYLEHQTGVPQFAAEIPVCYRGGGRHLMSNNISCSYKKSFSSYFKVSHPFYLGNPFIVRLIKSAIKVNLSFTVYFLLWSLN